MILTPIAETELDAVLDRFASRLADQAARTAFALIRQTPAARAERGVAERHWRVALAFARKRGMAVHPTGTPCPYNWDGAALDGDTEAYVILHEAAHYVLAPPERRALPDFGLGPGPDTRDRDGAERAAVLPILEREADEAMASLLGILWEAELGQPALASFLDQNWLEGLERSAAAHFTAMLRALIDRNLWSAPWNRIDLEGRVAIVTGGARGIGAAIADRLAASGARIAIWDIDTAVAENTAASIFNAVPIAADVTDPASIERALAATMAGIGMPDILINNAGITGPNHPLDEYPVEAWRQVIDIDLMGVFYCCRAVVPVMRRLDRGHIVNIASIAGKEGNPNASAYSAAKAGVIGLTKSLGKELAATGIRVNAVAPAAAKTDIFNQMTGAQIDYMLSKIPMGRFVQVEEIAALVAWLCSDECSFATGAVFDISGGRATY